MLVLERAEQIRDRRTVVEAHLQARAPGELRETGDEANSDLHGAMLRFGVAVRALRWWRVAAGSAPPNPPSATSAIPATTTTAPATRRAPTSSRSTTAASTTAM